MELTIITGHLGGDPEMRYTPGGQAVTNFSVAVARNYTDNNGQQVKRTVWYRVTAWGKQAEVVNQYFKRGDWILVQGKTACKFVDNGKGLACNGPEVFNRKDGTPAANFEITLDRFEFGPKGGNGSQQQQQSQQVDDDEIPF